MMDNFLGQILLVGFNFAPPYYMLCQGQLLSIRDYLALYSLLGTTYGGDGVQTFALPNLCGRTPIGMGQGPNLSLYQLGQTGGTEANALVRDNLPVAWQGPQHVQASTSDTAPSLPMASINPLPVNNMPPYLALNYIICTAGIFPSRQY